jgi:hypothetical protein
MPLFSSIRNKYNASSTGLKDLDKFMSYSFAGWAKIINSKQDEQPVFEKWKPDTLPKPGVFLMSDCSETVSDKTPR